MPGALSPAGTPAASPFDRKIDLTLKAGDLRALAAQLTHEIDREI